MAALLVTLGAAVAAHAADPPAFDLDATIETCTGCHGADGVPVDATIPIIAGQEFYYLYVQLKDYKSGLRASPIMSGIAAPLEKDDMKALAQHFAEMPWPVVDSSPDAALASVGRDALGAGQCSQCHSTYQGDSRIPRLAGQQLAYLRQTMGDFKNKVRLNSAAKGSLMNSFEDDALTGMAHQLSGL